MKNPLVSDFLNELKSPLSNEIELLRDIILNAHEGLRENIKWNGPNYSFEDKDRITMRVQATKQVQLIFHTGAAKTQEPENRLIQIENSLLIWKENNRAIATFKNSDHIRESEMLLKNIIRLWLKAAR